MDSLKKFDRYLQSKTFNVEDQVAFLKDYVIMTKYLSASDYFLLMSRYKSGPAKLFSLDALGQLSKGGTTSSAAKYWFQPLLVKAISIGERTGKISDSLTIVLDMVGKNRSVMKNNLVKFIAPTGVLVAVIFVMILLKEELISVVLKIVGGEVDRLPEGMRSLLDLTNWMLAYGYIIPLAILTSAMLLRHYLIYNTGRIRFKLDPLPIFKHYALFKGAQFLMNYSIMKRLGESDQDIITDEFGSAGPYYRKHLLTFSQKLGAGEVQLGDTLNGALFTPELIGRIKILSGAEEFTSSLMEGSIQTNDAIMKTLSIFITAVSKFYLAAVVMLVIPIITGLFSLKDL